MKRIKSLGLYQKFILIVLAIMAVTFSVIYPLTIARNGVKYKGTIFAPTEEKNCTVYRGKFKGEKAQIFVYDDGTILFEGGGSSFGPYTVTKSPSFLPKERTIDMVGVEIRLGDKVLFSGGVRDYSKNAYLFTKENGDATMSFVGTPGQSNLTYEQKQQETFEPSLGHIFHLSDEPELIHKGTWLFWFLGMLFCIITAYTVLFAKELFHHNMSYLIKNPEKAEPSESAIDRRNISWFFLVVLILILFIIGLH